MKPQRRPFMVEDESRHGLSAASDADSSTVVDEPSPDDLPSRDVWGDAADMPIVEGSTSLATSATASNLEEVASSEFTPEAQDTPTYNSPTPAVGRTGPILDTLLSVIPVEDASTDKRPEEARTKRQPKAILQKAKPDGQLKLWEVGPDPLTQPTRVTRSNDAVEASPQLPKPKVRTAKTRVPAGQG